MTSAASLPNSKAQASPEAQLKVFISYSRDDLGFADQLDAALDLCGFACTLDREGISGGEDWKRRLGGLILDADTVIFVLSPSSARSDVCGWEVQEALRLGKRILPVLSAPLGEARPPAQLESLNYIFFYNEPKAPGAGFGRGLAALVAALNTDLDWLRDHTRYLQRATEWDHGGREISRLLSGSDIATAKAWASRRPKGAPEPTPLQLDFIRASEEEETARFAAQREQLNAVAAAQAERGKALKEAEEALKQAADQQRKRARLRTIAFLAVSLVAVLAGWQWQRAERQREQAEALLIDANTLIVKFSAQPNIDAETSTAMRSVLERAAAQGNETAMYNLGVLYSNGIAVSRDYSAAKSWYEKAAAKGVGPAMFNLGVFHMNGLAGAQDYAAAKDWYEKAGAKGVSMAWYNLGILYSRGLGVAEDDEAARTWFEKAAAADNALAQAELGRIFEEGRGVPQDYARAAAWYDKAAANKDAGAANNLGVLYENGRGVTEDYAKAMEMFENGAAEGSAPAMVNIGGLFAKGHGVPQDFAKAAEWFEKAAAENVPEAQANLGLLYEYGQGVEKDLAKAREWYEKAAAQGNEVAINSLKRLAEQAKGETGPAP
jgi:TPR repeat protein